MTVDQDQETSMRREKRGERERERIIEMSPSSLREALGLRERGRDRERRAQIVRAQVELLSLRGFIYLKPFQMGFWILSPPF